MSAGVLAGTWSSFSEKAPAQDQPQRPQFYALQVVCAKNVQNANDSLAAPDGRHAKVLPGGQLVVLMENKLYPFPIVGWGIEGSGGPPDSGSIVGKAGEDFGLDGWFPLHDTEGKQHHDWIPLGPSATGFCLLPPPAYSFEDNLGVDLIRITNPGTESLFVDAVVGYGREADVLRPDWLRTLDGPLQEEVLAHQGELERQMWSTAGFFHAAGLTVTDVGEIVPRARATSAVFAFDPVRVACDSEGITRWELNPASQRRYLFRVRDAERYPAAMTAALRSLLKTLP